MTNIVILGPQRFQTCIKDAVKSMGLNGPFASITAGWQERESEIEELDEHLGEETLNLLLHQRGEDIFRGDPVFREAHRQHQAQLQKLQTLYRLRLNNLQGAVEDLMRHRKEHVAEMIDPEIEDAQRLVTLLDEHHLNRIQQLHDDFLDKWKSDVGAKVMDHHDEIAEILQRCSGVLIAGGHVAVLLNRIRLLRLEPLIRDKPIIAWSAGAMVLGQKVVIFHDSPPQGRGYAEVFENGLGLYPDMIPFPHAQKRLMLNDPMRVSMLAGRFPNDRCLTFEHGSTISFSRDRWHSQSGIRCLRMDGSLEDLELS